MALTAPRDPTAGAAAADRKALRRRLLSAREHFAAGPLAQAAQEALAAHLARLLHELEPEQLGVYWPVRSEFSAIGLFEAPSAAKLRLALPFATRQPPAMEYRAWDGQAPTGVDECGIPAPAAGAALVPEVVLVPCVGYTRSGYRLGYGGGYFDRWLAAHPQVTAIGIVWSAGELSEGAFAPQAHDRPLTLMLTELGVVA